VRVAEHESKERVRARRTGNVMLGSRLAHVSPTAAAFWPQRFVASTYRFVTVAERSPRQTRFSERKKGEDT
jgi:hypothetical protein